MGRTGPEETARRQGRRLTALFHEILLSAAPKRGGRPALVDSATGRTIRFDAVPGVVERISRQLAVLGVARGDVVGLVARNVPGYLPLVLGVLNAGAVVTPVNPFFLPHEMAVQLGACGASFVLADASLAETAGVAASAAGPASLILCDEAFELRRLDATPRGAAGVERGGEDGDALLAWSVGPGGLPAPARHSHATLSAALLGLAAVAPWREEDVVLSAISPYDLYGLVATLALSFHVGMTAVTQLRFTPESLAEAVGRYGVTVSNVVPTIVRALAEAGVPGGLAPLRLLISGGAPLAPHVGEACAARLGVAVVQGYGLAEAAGATHVDAPTDASRVASCGRPIAGTATRVVDVNGADVSGGEAGELWLRGEQVFGGYRANPEKTAAALTPERWLRTGDLVREDASGRMTIVGRRKRVVKVKGFQVSPAEVEAALRSHPAVSGAAVIPSWDAESGEERARALVVLRGRADAAGILEWLAARLARHKRPAFVEIISELPDDAGPWFFPWAENPLA